MMMAISSIGFAVLLALGGGTLTEPLFTSLYVRERLMRTDDESSEIKNEPIRATLL